MEKLVVARSLCVGCGQCVLICGWDALAAPKGELTVNDERCARCGICIDYCPVDALGFEET